MRGIAHRFRPIDPRSSRPPPSFASRWAYPRVESRVGSRRREEARRRLKNSFRNRRTRRDTRLGAPSRPVGARWPRRRRSCPARRRGRDRRLSQAGRCGPIASPGAGLSAIRAGADERRERAPFGATAGVGGARAAGGGARQRRGEPNGGDGRGATAPVQRGLRERRADEANREKRGQPAPADSASAVGDESDEDENKNARVPRRGRRRRVAAGVPRRGRRRRAVAAARALSRTTSTGAQCDARPTELTPPCRFAWTPTRTPSNQGWCFASTSWTTGPSTSRSTDENGGR